MITEQTLFSAASDREPDLDQTGGLPVAVDEAFTTAMRVRLDGTSWVEHVPGWLAVRDDLMTMLREGPAWQQRSRWMHPRTVPEPRLTAEYPVIAEAPQAVLHYL